LKNTQPKTTHGKSETAGSLLSKKDIIHPLLIEREWLRLVEKECVSRQEKYSKLFL